ncbi:hypothetical protein GRX01_06785 [Halobaculum sp. WSA2]|uniref:Putative heavy-metal chelation domain-containing protein n=1 Tax=Halobaculum saliterrae TaxID=2073113 RepID=A0A6B0SQ47_9EURY|nr:DUF364 domain-containing protein [Halobaculum saliterrae]MXR41044.1 hypothetical protein [Halobaculum saliterrae]
MSDAVLRAVRDGLRERDAFAGVSVERITLGDAAVLVELSGPDERTADRTDGDGEGADADGSGPVRAGLAHRPPGPDPDLDGVDVEALAAWALGEGAAGGGDDAAAVARAVGVATLNALSVPHVDWRAGDPMALLSPDVERVATVGLFRPAFRKFDDVEVRVVERDPVDPAAVSTPPGVTVSTFGPDEAATAMADTDVVFVTGSTLAYGGLDDSLAAAPPAATVVVIGASASTVPGPLFEAGADVVAGAAVDDVDAVRAAVRDGACGTDLHDAGVMKGYVAAAAPTGIDLDGERDTDGPGSTRADSATRDDSTGSDATETSKP